MTEEELKQVIQVAMPKSHVSVVGGGCNCTVTIVSETFSGKSRVARQQLVFEILGKHIASGEIHAITMKTWTPQEWERQING